MYGYYREKFHVDHFWELKGYGTPKVAFLRNYIVQFKKKMKSFEYTRN